jgi:hypothetical protein
MRQMLESEALTVGLHSQEDVLSLGDLWLRCFALGARTRPQELEGFLKGTLRLTRHEYNLIAVALNEYLVDIGMSPFVQYIEDDELRSGTIAHS